MKKTFRKLIIIAILLFLFQFLIQSSLAEEKVVIEYFYSSGCGSCEKYSDIMEEVEQNYTNDITVLWKDVKSETYYSEWRAYGFTSYPCAVINNKTKIPRDDNLTIFKNNLEESINTYLAGMKPNETVDLNQTTVCIPFFGCFDVSGFSLPVQTIILGGLDSFNPCAFFILLFLMNLLLYAKSRRRMFLIGGVFIFFSAFIYFIFMSALLNVFLLTENIGIITILAGVVALCLGIFNIKDFFFFKKGPSLGISDSKKPKLYKQMRDLVKTSHLPAVIGGAVFLAISVNTYELLCTLGLPFIFTRSLTLHNLSGFQYYTYIFFYNVVYVIPLIVIVLIFAFTLGPYDDLFWRVIYCRF